MQRNLVIVESPAKAKTIEKFLGSDYKVLSSYGHIRDLKKKEFSIDTDTFIPQYEIPSEKSKLVNDLKAQADKAETVWLASDEDREGEAISWHLYEVLGLNAEKTKRIVFHEITKPAILAAIENPRTIDLNLVNAQQARRVLDRIVGFKLSPVLWKKVKPALSAGRVQSVAVRLIVEREREIQQFKSEESYRITGTFQVSQNGNNNAELKAELNQRFKTKEEAKAFLDKCRTATYRIDDISTRPQKRTPAAPFTTSTLQQEAAHKLGFTVAQTMMIAQKLYESGRITYMRTDSVNLSTLCIGACTQVISTGMGEKYVKSRQYQTKSKGAQEAHEAIRPTDMNQNEIEGTPQERRLYDLIWKRTIASQMADAELEKTTASIQISGEDAQFVATGEVIKFDGFLKVYRETHEEDSEQEDERRLLPPLSKGQELASKEILAQQRFTQRPPRYNEASLVRKLEELGIGRPSTYAPTISTIQQREYVAKGDKTGDERELTTLILKDDKITEQIKTSYIGAERGKLIPTDIGIVVNDFLLQYFPEIMDYNFTAEVEKKFDDVAEGKAEWTHVMKDFYTGFDPLVENTLKVKSEHKVGERQLGKDPATGKPVFVKIGRFGPVVQIGSADDSEKPRFAQMKKEQSIETITLEEALDLFKLPRTLGDFEENPVTVGSGRFGPYIQHNKKYVSIPSDKNPMSITLDEAIALIQEKRQAEVKRHLKTFEEEPELEVLNGRYGPYLCYKGTNYRLPKTLAERAQDLLLEECMAVIKEQDDKPAKPGRGRKSTAKK
ncbi:MAG: type I DNA topoisomerase [Clostridium sp.]|nr:type I DNA topoisomerase [Clostridium sp.]